MSSAVEIAPWRPELRDHFERLNRRWLEQFDLLEPADEAHLQRPEQSILATGGQILFALADGRVVGTCAAIRVSHAVYELAKLAVAPEAQNRGVGRRLCEAVIELARRSGATRVELTSNRRLTAALHLYAALGFRDAPLPPHCPYSNADVCMALELAPFPDSLCHRCAHLRLVRSGRASTFLMCQEPSLPRYGPQPVHTCNRFASRGGR